MISQYLLVLTALAVTTTMATRLEDSPTISPVVIPLLGGGEGACPPSEVREAARRNLTEEVRTLMRSLLATKEVPECGEGQWLPVASLNMANLSESCPGDWKEINTPIRLAETCTHPESLGCMQFDYFLALHKVLDLSSL